MSDQKPPTPPHVTWAVGQLLDPTIMQKLDAICKKSVEAQRAKNQQDPQLRNLEYAWQSQRLG